MSKVNNLNPYRISKDERVINIASRHVRRFFACYDSAVKFEPEIDQRSFGLKEKLSRGSVTETSFPMILTLTELDLLREWYTFRQDYQLVDDEIEEILKEKK